MNLGLGTVQFGQRYGVSNEVGQPSDSDAAAILALAAESNVKWLDTAPAYGTSEEVLGRLLNFDHSFKIITKTPAFRKESLTAVDGRLLGDSFKRSLDRLRQTSLYGLLLHHSPDVIAQGVEHLVEAAQRLQQDRLLDKFGVSVYTAEDIDVALERIQPQIIQLPVSVFDQRLVRSGHLRKLKDHKIEVHARSLFLQGLLLMGPERAGDQFAALRPHLKRWQEEARRHSTTPLRLALAYARGLDLDGAIVGVTSAAELRQILSDWQAPVPSGFDAAAWALTEERWLNPSLWRIPAA